MTHQTIVEQLHEYIKDLTEIEGAWNGDTPRGEETALTAREIREKAEALRDIIIENGLV